jgi:hypothetical protein
MFVENLWLVDGQAEGLVPRVRISPRYGESILARKDLRSFVDITSVSKDVHIIQREKQ